MPTLEALQGRYALIRFGVACAVLAGTVAVAGLGGWSQPNTAPILWTCAVALVVVAASSWWARRSGSLAPAWTIGQLFLDCALTSVLCAVTGGVHTPLVLLYFPSIAAGAFQLRLRGALLTATFASLGLFVVAASSGRASFGGDGTVLLYTETMFRVFAFFLVATLSGQLAESAAQTGEALIAEQRSSAMLASEHEMVLDRVRAAVLTLDQEGRIVTMNPSAMRLLGDVAGYPVRDVLSFRPRLGRAWEETREGGSRWLCCADPLPDGGKVIVIEDVTELYRMREVAARDERLVGVGRLAASMAHEIRNPLASLTGCLQLVAEDKPDRLLTLALGEARRLNKLVEEFLSVSRSANIEPKPVELQALVGEVLAQFAADSRFAETVQASGGGSATTIIADPDRLRQVLWNLILNGAQAMPRGGRIFVTVQDHAEYDQGPDGVEIRVVDQGPGIPEIDRGRIFDPFFTTRSGGSGLGLAVVEQIVRAHGGRVSVQAPAEGGSAFVLWLPREAHAP